ncbi:TetR/AcrR family transcriptional regulator [Consotaella salsifontis]|uniref:Transcriptional regulator, TetR family n=1 Tax=Consotaella salsifontis TaxID=1365950 RepID=A0A1T4RWY1_9HYPH|nr:TetR/AcrR family transcriptional regulator [Consotaella salsifontis]SKA20514.1 transcriptional regulator, TetR family [Consotaella salsifontis]
MSQVTGERVAQKRRTRSALLAATRELLAEGHQPTVPEAADRAEISRATAYRYFSNPEELAEEAVLDAIAGELEKVDLSSVMRIEDAETRVEEVVSSVLGMVIENEKMFRTYLGVTLGSGSARRRGARRIGWLKEAMEPMREALGEAAFARAVNALSLTVGIETIIVFKDVCGLDEEEIHATARWLTRAVLAQCRAGG